jgi:O-antigen ligase
MPIKYSYIGVIFEQAFYYHGHLRWSLGWATPNYAGAFLVTVEPVIWISTKLAYDKSRIKTVNYCQFAAELVLWFLLAQTFSRGSIVAAFCARATWQAMQGELTSIKTWAGYLFAPVACIISSGFIGRIYYTVTTADPSVTHRLELWTAGLRMLAASPWTGWGSGKSGVMYMNWYQSAGHIESFATMVNSYLNLAVEHGLAAFCLVIFISIGVLHGGVAAAKSATKASRKHPALVLGAATSAWMAWLVANIFTNLWTVTSLWIVPMSAVGFIAGCRDTWQAWGPREILRYALLSLSAGLALFSAGILLEHRSRLMVHHSEGDTITLERRVHSPENRPVIDIWPDPLVLGDFPGRQLRTWVQQADGPESLSIHTQAGDGTAERKSSQGKRIFVLVGREASRLQSLQVLPSDSIILVHPLQLAKEGLGPLRGHKAVVVIPGIDQSGTNDAIRNEANAVGAIVLVSPGVGLDLQAAWPDIMKDAVNPL